MPAYLRLMRLHQPTGIWLLLWPCWWSIALASHGLPSIRLLFLFAAGAILMRGAGCIINDMADRKIDAQVERTKNRPLASGEVSMVGASVLLVLLIAVSAYIAFLLGPVVMMWAVMALIPVVIYPFMKRISWWPQLILGMTFNWGALMGWAAVRGQVDAPALILYLGGIGWTLGYDTIYAYQDRVDDARIGVKSTALYFGDKAQHIIGVFYLMAIMFWAAAGWMTGCDVAFFVMLLFAELKLGWQICNVDWNDATSCRYIFKSNAAFGWLIFAGCLVGEWQALPVSGLSH